MANSSDVTFHQENKSPQVVLTCRVVTVRNEIQEIDIKRREVFASKVQDSYKVDTQKQI